MPHDGLVKGQTLPLPRLMDERDELEIREAIWWNLSPGEVGYNQSLEDFLGVTEREWTFYKLTGIKPAHLGG